MNTYVVDISGKGKKGAEGLVPLRRKVSRKSAEISEPITPFPKILPLNDPNFPWEEFETFCEHLVSRLNFVKETHHWGSLGSRQEGIDFFADLTNGRRWAFQCKKQRKFTPGDAKKAIRETTFRADCYFILLSVKASSGVRKVCERYPKWDVWDTLDISKKVLELDTYSASRLIETSFGRVWRKKFLGVSGLTPFVSPKDFFHRWMKVDSLLTHSWSLVDRKEILASLHRFTESKQLRVALLFGRGSIGKTKVLHAFAEEFDSYHKDVGLWFIEEGVPISPDSFDEVPTKACIMVLDDAHRCEDLQVVLAFVQRVWEQAKLVLTSRSEGVDRILNLLAQAGFGSGEILRLDEIKELGYEEMKELARQSLGNKYARLAGQLAAVTKDSPLVTLAGGLLLRKKGIDPRLLANDSEFRYTVLSRFSDVLAGKVSDVLEASLCKNLLDLIAAVGPIRVNEEPFQLIAADFLGISRPRLMKALDVLVEAGILLRRGYALRITPDVVADHILHAACLTSGGQPTGYASQIFEKFGSSYPKQVLLNLAELDWRIRLATQRETNLLTDIWNGIEREFQSASNSRRCFILDLLKDLAYYIPGRVLPLAEFAMQHPATVPEDPQISRIHSFSHEDVLHRLPALLRVMAYTQDYLSRCCVLLWQSGRDDERELNRYPDHAIRVLADFASYDKPMSLNLRVLEAAEKWLNNADAHDHMYSPLDVLDPLLAKSGLSTHTEGNKFAWVPFIVSPEKVREVRKRVVKLVLDCAHSNSLKVTMRALRSLEEALREPVSYFGQQISDTIRAQWLPDQLELLDHINKLASDIKRPLAQIRIIEILSWHASYSSSEQIKNRSHEVISSIPDCYELRLIRVLTGRYGHDLATTGENRKPIPYCVRQQREEELCTKTATEFMERFPDATEGVHILNDKLQEIGDIDIPCQPGLFLHELSKMNPNYAVKMCYAIIQTPDCILTQYSAPLLRNVRNADEERAIAIIRCAEKTGKAPLLKWLALTYWANDWARKPRSDDVEVIEKLLVHSDPTIRRTAIGSLRVLGRYHGRLAVGICLTIDIGDSRDLASEFFLVFIKEIGISPEILTDEEMILLLNKIEFVRDIDDYHIVEFLSYASRRMPKTVVHLLLKRIERAEGRSPWDYAPLPHHTLHGKLDGITQSSDYEDILRKIRDWTLKKRYQTCNWVSMLFVEISSSFCPISINILNEWVVSESAEKIDAVSCLLTAAPEDFVFSHRDFVANLIERSSAAGIDCFRRTNDRLFQSATTGVRTSFVGQPSPQDIALRDKANEAASLFLKGSPVRRFYELLAERAEHRIQWEQSLEDELLS